MIFFTSRPVQTVRGGKNARATGRSPLGALAFRRRGVAVVLIGRRVRTQVKVFASFVRPCGHFLSVGGLLLLLSRRFLFGPLLRPCVLVIFRLVLQPNSRSVAGGRAASQSLPSAQCHAPRDATRPVNMRQRVLAYKSTRNLL